MANVRGLNDLNEIRHNVVRPIQQIRDKVPFMDGLEADRQPLQQTIPYTIKLICFPSLKLVSLTTGLTVCIWVMFVVSCIKGIDTHTGVLTIATNVLIELGAAQSSLIKQGQVYRLLTASFLHADLLHVVMNTITLLFLMSRFEKIYGWATASVLVVSSIAGFTLSVLVNSTTVTCGASAMLFGVLGGYVAYLIINWTVLGLYGQVRFRLACIIGFILFFSILLSIGPSIDILAHVGGLVGGLFISLALLPAIQTKPRIIFILGLIAIITFLFTMLLIFYLK